METDERNLTPDEENAPENSEPEDVSSDDVRFAPLVQTIPEAEAIKSELDVAQTEAVEAVAVEEREVTDGMDIEAALAAVSTLSDMLAQQEAAEQARIAQEEAIALAAAERQARMEHPERFFPVPPMSSLHRGQMASVIPALVLILSGAWLTFTLTTTKAVPDGVLLTGIASAGMGLTLLIRWLSSGRWTRGSLFFGLALLSAAVSIFYLSQPSSPGLVRGWPLLLVTLGIAVALTGLLAVPRSNRLLMPGGILVIAGIAGLIITLGLLDGDLAATVGTLWPVTIGLVIVIWSLPLIFRQRG